MASSALSVCSSDLSYGSRVCLPGSCDSYTGSSWQVDDCPESCCEPPCCAPSCCTPAPRLTLLCAPLSCLVVNFLGHVLPSPCSTEVGLGEGLGMLTGEESRMPNSLELLGCFRVFGVRHFTSVSDTHRVPFILS
ncbi:hypothetical protein JEQ12_001881 [Ovis aries]|uniref:Keratin-associated protein n=1 Tax=Ovis aries TaxID=9940 RepID=A0A836D920_SHEEP|nr:hypothetical protein JEQ12_001881 [Ovis aries]